MAPLYCPNERANQRPNLRGHFAASCHVGLCLYTIEPRFELSGYPLDFIRDRVTNAMMRPGLFVPSPSLVGIESIKDGSQTPARVAALFGVRRHLARARRMVRRKNRAPARTDDLKISPSRFE